MSKGKSIFLIGFMGCGKSTFGRKLAAQFDYEFIDMDTFIEEQSGKTIPQIFAEEGEDYFRNLEKEAIKELSNKKNCVIATGGGAPCFNDNMALMNELGITVYLELSPEKLAQRLVLDKTERPVLQGKNGDELVAHISSLLQNRELYYKTAKITVDADSPEDLLALL